MNDPALLLCGILCLYPLIFFGIPAFLIGRYWGRLRITIDDPVPTKHAAARQARRDVVGYGTKD
jgi:hypothetical protein